ncbi:hypothetical protein Q1695_005895 [Nippostrongylus brasiliensis]|nr:hypothetical protein Q1695_005895 [Nippostrongylus brasiliensis]
MNGGDEFSDSMIPEFALEIALSGKDLPRIVKKTKETEETAAAPSTAVEESSDDETPMLRPRSKPKKQLSLTTFLTVPRGESLGKPVHNKSTTKKGISAVRKKIEIDPPDTPKRKKVVGNVVAELSGDDDRRFEAETDRLEKSISKAQNRSIRRFLGSNVNGGIKREQARSKTPRQRKRKAESTQSEPSVVTAVDDEVVEDSFTMEDEEENTATSTRRNSSPEDIRDVEVVQEIRKTTATTPRSKKRPRKSTPRGLQRVRASVSVDFALDCNPDQLRAAHTTPRRKISRQKSYSPLNFVVDDEDRDSSPTSSVRRRRLSGERSIFDLEPSPKDFDHHPCSPSTSSGKQSSEARSLHVSHDTVVVDAASDSSESEELEFSPPNRRSSENGARRGLQAEGNSQEFVLPSSESDIESVRAGLGSVLRTPPRKDGQCTANAGSSTGSTPSRSLSLSSLLYSPRKMAQSNRDRLSVILAKKDINYEIVPDLDRLLPGVDFCGFNTSSLQEGKPPVPMPKDREDTELNFGTPAAFVRLPWSTANIMNGFHQYVIIERALRALVQDGALCVESVIVALKECAPWIKSFDGLYGFMDGLSSTEERQALDVIAGIAKLAVNAKFILTAPVPLLRSSQPGSVTLSQEQCACLLAHAFFCTYRRERHNFNRINMANLFDGRNPLSHVKLRFILHYFAAVLKNMPTGCVSFWREALPKDALPDWEQDETPLPLLAVASDSSIEDSPGCLQVDFANEYIGGGVLNWGAVQEEIRFLICPEMMVSCLLCEKMGPLEVIHIVGAQRYSSYCGYGETLEWEPYERFGVEPRDKFRRVKCELVAMDAKLFKPGFRNVQYKKESIDRDLNKAYVGFLSRHREASPVATGNWGCGVFGGDKELKSLIQMIAAGRAGRDMIYYTFANQRFEVSMSELYEKLVQKKATVGAVYKALIAYDKERLRNPRLTVYEHVYAFISEISCTAS